MKDFDSARAERNEREQGFKMGGENFRINPGVHPSVFSRYEDAVLSDRDELLEAMDSLIKAFLWDDATRKLWDKVRASEKNPVTIGDLRGLLNYLYEVESELPTSAPEPSSGGRARTRRQSGDASSSPAGAAT